MRWRPDDAHSPPTLHYGSPAPGPWFFRAGASLGVVGVSPLVLFATAKLLKPWLPSQVSGVVLLVGMLMTCAGPLAGAAIVIGGIGFRRHRQTRFAWVQALGVASIVASCARGTAGFVVPSPS